MLVASKQIPVDASLPVLPACLDGHAVLTACRAQLPQLEEGVKAQDWCKAHLIEALYHPGRYVRVVYALLSDPETPEHRYWPEGQLVYLHAPVRQPVSRRGTVLHLAGEDVEAYRFPNDRRLRGLRNFARRDSCVQAMEGWIGGGVGGGRIEPDSLQRLLVRYVPEQKWIVRLRAELTGSNHAKRTKCRLAVRAASPTVIAALEARHNLLNESPKETGPRFQIPRVVGVDRDGGLLATQWIRGDNIVEALDGGDVAGVLGEVASRLLSLHVEPASDLPRVDRVALLQRAEHAVGDLQVVAPSRREQLDSVWQRLQSTLKRVVGARVALIHNDFHWKQLTIKRDRFALLDLERLAAGDPLLDVVNFATQLQMLGYRPEYSVDVATADRWCRTFLDKWERCGGEPVDETRLTCYAALFRLELARGMMRHLRTGWPDLLASCVDRCSEELVDGGGAAS